MNHDAVERRIGTCVLCEAACGIVVEVERTGSDRNVSERVVSLRGDTEDPMSKGFVCPKVIGMKELHEDPDRLRHPMVREAGVLREATWDEALDRAAAGLRHTRELHGPDALAIYQGNPAAHNLGLMTVGQVVLRTFGTKNLYSASSADQIPQMLAAEELFGNPVLMPVPDVDRTDYMLIIGANPLVSNGSLMTAPNMKARLEKIRERGGRVVVVDPRRTETAQVANEHVFIRPGSDPIWLLAVLNVVFAEGLAKPERVIDGCDGWQELEALASEVTPERVAERTGVEAATTRSVARGFARANSAVAYGRIGICHQAHGSVAAWLVTALNVVTGNLDRPGGAMFTTSAVRITQLVRMLGFVGHDRWRSRVRELPEVSGELPVATLADEIETPGPGQVRALLTCAGNPVLSAPNGSRIDRALGKLAFMVSVDGYINETTCHADVILPPVSPLERPHYDIALNAFAVRNTAKLVAAPLSPPAGALEDWEILLELGLRARLDGSKVGRLTRWAGMKVGRSVGPIGMLDALLRVGPHRLSVRKLRRHPHGLDLGPLQPRLPKVLETKSGRVQLCPASLAAEARDTLVWTSMAEADAPAKLLLVGRRHLRSNNSWMHNSKMLVKGPERCTLLMHPSDASSLKLSSGARVEVASRVGRVVVPLEVSDEMMRGVVSLPHGFGHDRPNTVLGVASRHAGVSANDLTDDLALDASTGNAAFSGIPVEVRLAFGQTRLSEHTS